MDHHSRTISGVRAEQATVHVGRRRLPSLGAAVPMSPSSPHSPPAQQGWCLVLSNTSPKANDGLGLGHGISLRSCFGGR